MDELKEELLATERAGWDSLCNGTGDDFYGRTMTADGLMVLANGQIMTRDDVVGALGQAPPWAAYEMSDVRVVPMGDEVAALVYVGTAHRQEGDVFKGAMASVYVRAEGGWQLALYQQTPIT
jgi:hypothetical protein